MWFVLICVLSLIWAISNFVYRFIRSPMMLFFVADKCCTKTKAIPQSEGVFLKKVSKASNPPADAPIPTTGMVGFTAFLEGVFDFLPACVLISEAVCFFRWFFSLVFVASFFSKIIYIHLCQMEKLKNILIYLYNFMYFLMSLLQFITSNAKPKGSSNLN